MSKTEPSRQGDQAKPADSNAPRKLLTPAAERALAEAAARRAARDKPPESAPAEVDGRGSLDPVRYGDWEVKGIASDF